MHTRILCRAQDLGWQGTHLIILDGVRREADVLHILPDVTHHLWESRREVLMCPPCSILGSRVTTLTVTLLKFFLKLWLYPKISVDIIFSSTRCMFVLTCELFVS